MNSCLALALFLPDWNFLTYFFLLSDFNPVFLTSIKPPAADVTCVYVRTRSCSFVFISASESRRGISVGSALLLLFCSFSSSIRNLNGPKNAYVIKIQQNICFQFACFIYVSGHFHFMYVIYLIFCYTVKIFMIYTFPFYHIVIYNESNKQHLGFL